MIKESSESFPRHATRVSLSLCPSPKSFARTCPLRCTLPSPVIVVAIVIERVNIVTERLNIVTERHSCVCIAVAISVRTYDVHNLSLIFSNLVVGF